ncbi:hypothetical protein [Halorarum salinum]|uniref:Uncharacterized protein n=1 Tax=Halorarum salinum TaxID=2743089 RepID=A0A7D5QAK7_9EURY|nr:hypothetical protein [Halobaculum salinum]QLG62656.1 hypothetical protein HUG12_13345 [Halobaculum salinum]
MDPTTFGRRLLQTRTARAVANHPRAATALVLSVLLLATSGSAAADSLVSTTGEGWTKTGP